MQGGRLSQEDADALFEELEFLQQQVAAKQAVSGWDGTGRLQTPVPRTATQPCSVWVVQQPLLFLQQAAKDTHLTQTPCTLSTVQQAAEDALNRAEAAEAEASSLRERLVTSAAAQPPAAADRYSAGMQRELVSAWCTDRFLLACVCSGRCGWPQAVDGLQMGLAGGCLLLQAMWSQCGPGV